MSQAPSAGLHDHLAAREGWGGRSQQALYAVLARGRRTTCQLRRAHPIAWMTDIEGRPHGTGAGVDAADANLSAPCTRLADRGGDGRLGMKVYLAPDPG